jgi:hypothetical protein
VFMMTLLLAPIFEVRIAVVRRCSCGDESIAANKDVMRNVARGSESADTIEQAHEA